MDKPAAPSSLTPKPSSSDLDKDLSDLIPALSKERPPSEGDRDEEPESPDQALSDLLEVLDHEINTDKPSGSPVQVDPDRSEPEPAAPGTKNPETPETATKVIDRAPAEAKAEPPAAPEAPLPDSAEDVVVASDDQALDADLSALIPSHAGKGNRPEAPVSPEARDCVKSEASETVNQSPQETAEDLPRTRPPDPSEPAASAADATAMVVLDRWRYLKAAALLLDEGLERAEEAVDSFHPRAKFAVGMVGIAMLSLALVLFATQLLGWI